MIFFKKNTEINNIIVEDLKRKISNLELDVEKLKTQMLSLRGFVNRNLSKIDPPEESNDLNNESPLRFG
jgi:hypothetical protein